MSWNYYRYIDNWHSHPWISWILCKIGRHDYEFMWMDGDSAVDAVGIKDVIDNIKGWYSIGEERYNYGGDEEKMNKHHWDQFVHFAGMASRISRVVDGGSDVALVCISYGDEDSLSNLSSEGIRVIEGYE